MFFTNKIQARLRKQAIKAKPIDWRDGLICYPFYIRVFAFLSVECEGGNKVWAKHYYRKYATYSTPLFKGGEEHEHLHTDFIESITEEEFLIRKIADTL
jgi:hypothetical protein